MSSAWIGFDLDGTLATYGSWQGVNHIGEPIMPNINRLRSLLARGMTCKIMTARVSRGGAEAQVAVTAIHHWLKKNGLPKLEVVSAKDYAMLFLIDDRAVAVETNTGVIMGGSPSALATLDDDCYQIPEGNGGLILIGADGASGMFIPGDKEAE